MQTVASICVHRNCHAVHTHLQLLQCWDLLHTSGELSQFQYSLCDLPISVQSIAAENVTLSRAYPPSSTYHVNVYGIRICISLFQQPLYFLMVSRFSSTHL